MRFLLLKTLFLVLSFQSVAQKLQTYQKDKLWGLADENGSPLTLPIYSAIHVGSDYSIVSIWNEAKAQYLTGTIDAKGKTLIATNYVDLKRDGLRLIACRKLNQSFRYGLLLASGKEIIPLDFVSVQSLGSMRYAVENEQKKFAIYDDAGVNLTGFTLENLIEIKPNLIQFTQNGWLGFLDRQGNIIKEARYTTIKIENEKVIGVLPRQWELISLQDFTKKDLLANDVQFTSSGKIIIEHKTNDVQLYTNQLQKIGKSYHQIKKTLNQQYFVATEGGKQLIITQEGKTIQSSIGDSIVIEKNYAWIKKGKHWQTFSLQLQTYNSSKYDSFKLINHYAIVYKQGYEGLLNEIGEESIPCVYNAILDANENQILVKIQNLTGIINWQEKWLLSPQPNSISLINDKLYLLTEGKLKYLKNFQHQILYFTNNSLIIKEDYIEETTSRGEKWKIDAFGIATSLVPKINHTFQQIQSATEGYAAIKKDNKWGFTDLQGRLRIANRYDSVLPFAYGTAAFKLRNKWGLLNKEDKIVLQPAYDSLKRINENLMIASKKNQAGIINLQGEIILPFRFDKVELWLNENFLLTKDDLLGWADKDGRLIVEPKYQAILPTKNFLLAKILNLWGVVDFSGKQKISALYEVCSPSADGHFILTSKGIQHETVVLK